MMTVRRNTPTFALCLILAMCAVGLCLTAGKGYQGANCTPPTQPATGPGGADMRFGGMVQKTVGTGATACNIFVPQNPTPESAPVVIFTHGWSAISPNVYGSWIEHIVRHEGAIVLYPAYQDSSRTLPTKFLPNAIAGIQEAMNLLRTGSLGVQPMEDKGAYVGHSMGGVLAANLAAVAHDEKLPLPRAVFCAEPGGSGGPPRLAPLVVDLTRIPRGTLLLTLSGDQDRLAGDRNALRIYKEATQIPVTDKDYIVVHSDDHGTPALVANHGMPAAMKKRGATQTGDATQRFPRLRGGDPSDTLTNALDYYGTWKLFDGLCDTVFYGTHREYALGNTPQQRNMGNWSDGVPVKPLTVSDPK